ncbi:MAG TPA: hypothetical protein VEH04_09140 [Verrucomicrobiae bacterium]|nr:hypothetical protein [Verrucomicrobiae bacterium]
MENTTKTTVAALALAMAGIASSPAAWVNNGQYPWGSSTHNGNVYMVTSAVTPVSGGYRITASQPGLNGKKYRSGVIYESGTLKLRSNKAIGAQARVSAPTARGTWPAFWITTLGGWTGEVDIAEWKGSGTVWQNTYDGGWENYTRSSNNTMYKTHIQAKNDGTNHAWVWLYINNAWSATHTGNNFVGKDWWLIANLQMEGSSGSPGPTSAQVTFTSMSAWGF